MTGKIWTTLTCPQCPQINLSFTMGWIYTGRKVDDADVKGIRIKETPMKYTMVKTWRERMRC